MIGAAAFMEKPLNTAGKTKVRKWKETDTLYAEGGNLKYSFYTDFKKYDILAYAKKIKIPFLVIHGKKDYTVGMSQGNAIAKAANAQLKLIDEGHIFDKKAIPPIVAWFNKTLRR